MERRQTELRARNVKPGFYKDDLLAECEPLARILLTGLWCLADREGRLEYRPRRIKAEALPYDDIDICKLLDQLNTRGFIVVYRYGDEIFLEIPGFAQEQSPNVKEGASTIPAPCEHDTCMVLVSPLPPSPFLFPDNPLPPNTPKRARAQGTLRRFGEFWDAYPKKKAKGDAEKAWARINPSELLIEQILSAVQRAKTSKDWTREDGRYIPHPATWLNRKGWEDEYPQGGSSGNGNRNAESGAASHQHPVDLSE